MKPREYLLNADGLDQIAAVLQEVLSDQGLERREALRIRLTMEELLLRVMEAQGEDPVTVTLSMKKRFGTQTILLRYGGPSFDPTGAGEENNWGDRLLQSLGLDPVWRWQGGENRVQLQVAPRRKGGQLRWILLALAAAGVLGAAGRWIPPETMTLLIDILLTPTFNAFLGLLTTFAGLMIFLTVASGIFGIGDTAALSRVGRVMFPRILAGAFAASALVVPLLLPFLDLTFAGEAGGSSQLQEISDMLFAILPKNPVQSFLDGNAMQIVVMAVFAGVVLLMLGERTRQVSTFIEEAAVLVQTMLSIVCKLIPLFVFVSLLRMIWSGSTGKLLELWKPLVMDVGLDILFAAGLLALAALRTRVVPGTILGKALPPATIAFTTASCMAAYPTTMETGEKELGVDRRLLEFGLPVGVVLYMPAAAISYMTVSLFLAELYGVAVSPSWFLMAVLVCAILSCAVPPLPGASLTCYGILLTQLGIPAEGLLLAAALDIILDFVSSGFVVLDLELELVRQAGILGMLDRETLARK